MCLYVSCLCVYMCLYVLYQQMGLFVDVYMYFWSFIHVSFVGTQCGFFPLCVTNFVFVTGLLLMHYFALCVLCISYVLSMTMCIFIKLVPISFNDLLMYWIWCYCRVVPEGLLLVLGFY